MKRLLLLGGGHAHVAVLDDLARAPIDGWRVEMVTPFTRQIYSGMLPGWLAGHYPIEACAIRLDALAAQAGVALHETAGTALDPGARRVQLADGRRLGYDLLSIDTGPQPDLAALPGADTHGQPVRPIERFIAAWPALAARIAGAAPRRFRLLMLGGGAAGVELLLALHHRAQREGWRHLDLGLVGASAAPWPDAPRAAQRRLLRRLLDRDIAWHGGHRAQALAPGVLRRDGAPPLPFDACWIATGSAAPAWAAAAGLATDAQGFIAVERTLRSRSHAEVFAAGDVAALPDARPKSGVFAVRAGPVLAANLRAACTGRPLALWRPQARALYLLATGERHAVGTWGPLSWQGRWVWRWKDRIDRAFMRRFGTDAMRNPDSG